MMHLIIFISDVQRVDKIEGKVYEVPRATASQSPKPITFSDIPNIFLNSYPKTYEPGLFRDKGGGFYIQTVCDYSNFSTNLYSFGSNGVGFIWSKTINNTTWQADSVRKWTLQGNICTAPIDYPEVRVNNFNNYTWWAIASTYQTTNQNKCWDHRFYYNGGPTCDTTNILYDVCLAGVLAPNNPNANNCLASRVTPRWGTAYIDTFAKGIIWEGWVFINQRKWGLWGWDNPMYSDTPYIVYAFNSQTTNKDLAIELFRTDDPTNPTYQRGEVFAFINDVGSGTGYNGCAGRVIYPPTGTNLRRAIAWAGLNVGRDIDTVYFQVEKVNAPIQYRQFYKYPFGGVFRWQHNNAYRWTVFAFANNSPLDQDPDIYLTDLHKDLASLTRTDICNPSNGGYDGIWVVSAQNRPLTDFVLIDFNKLYLAYPSYYTAWWWARVPMFGSWAVPNNFTGYAQAWDGDSITISQICTSTSCSPIGSPITFTFYNGDLIRAWDLVFDKTCSNGWVITLERTSGTLSNVRMAIFAPRRGTPNYYVFQTRAAAYYLSGNANPTTTITIPASGPVDGYSEQYGLVVFRDGGTTLENTPSNYRLYATCSGTTPAEISENNNGIIDIVIKQRKVVLEVKQKGKVSVRIYSTNGSVNYKFDGILYENKEIPLRPGIYFYKLNEKSGKLIVK